MWLSVDPLAEREEFYKDPDSTNGGIYNQQNLSVYSFSYNNPVKYVDPDGECPNCVTAAGGAVVGAIIGGGIEAGKQLWDSGKITNWRAVGGSAAQGAITGAAAGFTGGASLAVTVGTSAAANVAGGEVNRRIQGHETTGTDVAVDAAVGGAFGVASKGVSKIFSKANSAITRNSVENKLSGYLLNPNHPQGGSKANWFKKALGFDKNNMSELAKQIKFDPKSAVSQGKTQYGEKFQTIIPIKGANGKTIQTKFIWQISKGQNDPKLITAIPANK